MSFIEKFGNLNDCYVKLKDGKRAIIFTPHTISVDGVSLITNSQIEELVKLGRLYTIQTVLTINNSTTKYLLFDPTLVIPNLPDFLGNVIAFPFRLKTTAGPITVCLYAGTDYAEGTLQPLINRNANSPNTSLTTIKADPTGSNKGTLLFKYLVGQASQTAVFPGGGDGETDLPFILDITKKMLLEIPNNSGENIQFEIRFNVGEF